MENKSLHAPLSPQQNAFVIAYCECFNAGKAALMAGYSHTAYGYVLYKKENVRAIINEKMGVGVDHIDTARGISEIEKMAYSEQELVPTENGGAVIFGTKCTTKLKALFWLQERRDEMDAVDDTDDIDRFIIRVPDNGRFQK